jgi:hypothetical protein
MQCLMVCYPFSVILYTFWKPIIRSLPSGIQSKPYCSLGFYTLIQVGIQNCFLRSCGQMLKYQLKPKFKHAFFYIPCHCSSSTKINFFLLGFRFTDGLKLISINLFSNLCLNQLFRECLHSFIETEGNCNHDNCDMTGFLFSHLLFAVVIIITTI